MYYDDCYTLMYDTMLYIYIQEHLMMNILGAFFSCYSLFLLSVSGFVYLYYTLYKAVNLIYCSLFYIHNTSASF